MQVSNLSSCKVPKSDTAGCQSCEKVIFVIQGLGKGGAEKFLISLVNSVSTQGVEPVVISLSDNNTSIEDIAPAIKLHILTRKYKYDLSIASKIKEIVLAEQAQKVFCIGAFAFFLAKLMLLRYQNIRFFLSLHTTVPFTLKHHFLDVLYLRFISKSDKVIFICQNQKEYYKKAYLFNPSQSEVIYNGIDLGFAELLPNEEQQAMRAEVRHALDISNNAKVIVKVANIHPVKGHYYAVEALTILHNYFNTKAHLVLVGASDSENYRTLIQHIHDKQLEDYVHVAGAKADVRPYLICADIFTLTSYSETFSIAALEAMSFGIPCSLTNTGGAAEMLEDPQCGTLSTARNAHSIAQSWYDLLTADHDSAYIKRYAKTKFSFDKMVAAYLLAFLKKERVKHIRSTK